MLLPLLTGEGREKHQSILQALAELVDEGKLKPLIDKEIFSFEQIVAAHRYFESGQVIGKLLLLRNEG